MIKIPVSRGQLFFAGMWTMAAIHNFIQDMFGQAAWIEHLQASWWNTHPIIWVPFIGMGLWIAFKGRLYINPDQEVYLGNDGKAYTIVPVEPEEESKS
jgi:hypothetical protein